MVGRRSAPAVGVVAVVVLAAVVVEAEAPSTVLFSTSRRSCLVMLGRWPEAR